MRFERGVSQIDFLLRTECLFRPGNTWLLRISTDGLAYQIKDLKV